MRSLIAAMLFSGFVVGCAQTSESPLGPATPVSSAEADRDTPRDEFGVGDRAPEFDGLTGVDDKQHSLDDFADAKAVAIVFTCNKCPVAQAYEDRLIALDKEYGDKGVQLVAINVNNADEDKLPAMKERATEKGFEFPYLYDPTQKVGRDYGASVTPHVFLLDGKRRLAYVGPIDDNPVDPDGAKPYLRDAIDAVLAGKEPETTEVRPLGCGIQYE